MLFVTEAGGATICYVMYASGHTHQHSAGGPPLNAVAQQIPFNIDGIANMSGRVRVVVGVEKVKRSTHYHR